MRYIINADDFGLHKSCSIAIADAFRENLITDTTACANGNYIKEAITIAKEYGFFDRIGIHFNITTGVPLTEEIKNSRTFCDDQGRFIKPKNRYFIMSRNDKKLLYNELITQYHYLQSLGVDVTHADSHHHIHTGIAYIPTFNKVFKACGINKVRVLRNTRIKNKIKAIVVNILNYLLYKRKYVTTDFFGDVTDALLIDEEKKKILEIMIHPDYDPKSGQMIDRYKYQKGIPVGVVMNDYLMFLKRNSKSLISYRELFKAEI